MEFLGPVAIVLIVLVLLVIYFIPTIVAGARHHRHFWFIFLLNFLLGGTAIGWVAALIWAVLVEPVEPAVAAPPPLTPSTDDPAVKD